MDKVIQFPALHQTENGASRNEKIRLLFDGMSFPATKPAEQCEDADGNAFIQNGVLRLRVDEERFLEREEESKQFPDLNLYQEETEDFLMWRDVYNIRVNLKSYADRLNEWYENNYGLKNIFKNSYLKTEADEIIGKTYLGTELCHYFELQHEFQNILDLMRDQNRLSRAQYKKLSKSADHFIKLVTSRVKNRKRLNNFWNRLQESGLLD